MFSEVDRPLGSDTLEYGWLIEIQCGSLFGKVTSAQLYNIFVCMEVKFFTFYSLKLFLIMYYHFVTYLRHLSHDDFEAKY